MRPSRPRKGAVEFDDRPDTPVAALQPRMGAEPDGLALQENRRHWIRQAASIAVVDEADELGKVFTLNLTACEVEHIRGSGIAQSDPALDIRADETFGYRGYRDLREFFGLVQFLQLSKAGGHVLDLCNSIEDLTRFVAYRFDVDIGDDFFAALADIGVGQGMRFIAKRCETAQESRVGGRISSLRHVFDGFADQDFALVTEQPAKGLIDDLVAAIRSYDREADR